VTTSWLAPRNTTELVTRLERAARGQAPDFTVTPEPTDCRFCEIFAGRGEAQIVRSWLGSSTPTLAIRPLEPVTPGHTIVIPGKHVPDFSSEPHVTAITMAFAAQLAAESPDAMNIISSRGAAATQSVFHLHVHLVPRHEGDGLPLPWTPQKSAGE
jgi:histidine triad (HIT) family protein